MLFNECLLKPVTLKEEPIKTKKPSKKVKKSKRL